MVHKNNKWNISIEKGKCIIHKTLTEILKSSDNNRVPLNDLVILMNHKTNHIKFINKNQSKPLSVYIRCVYGSLISFLDDYIIYGIMDINNTTYVKLITEKNKTLNYEWCSVKDWELLVHEEFILI